MVRINGEDKALAGINLLEYLKDAGYQLEKIVVERNLEIIPRDQLENVVIQENDSIEVLSFVGGGCRNLFQKTNWIKLLMQGFQKRCR